MAATAVTLNYLEGHAPVAGLFKCNPLNICAAFYTISTDNVLARSLGISRASCYTCRPIKVSTSLNIVLAVPCENETPHFILLEKPLSGTQKV